MASAAAVLEMPDNDLGATAEVQMLLRALADSLDAEREQRRRLLAKLKYEVERGDQILVDAGLNPTSAR